MREYITELANDIAKSCPDLVENGCGNDNCVACLAFKLTGLGYQKQEWISVGERLPEPNVLVLAILDEPCLRLNFPFEEHVLILLRERLPYSVGIVEEWRRPFSSETINYDGRVTHWMPLPEAPKMKGGAE